MHAVQQYSRCTPQDVISALEHMYGMSRSATWAACWHAAHACAAACKQHAVQRYSSTGRRLQLTFFLRVLAGDLKECSVGGCSNNINGVQRWGSVALAVAGGGHGGKAGQRQRRAGQQHTLEPWTATCSVLISRGAMAKPVCTGQAPVVPARCVSVGI